MSKKNVEIKCECGCSRVVPCHIYTVVKPIGRDRYRCLNCGVYIERKIIILNKED